MPRKPAPSPIPPATVRRDSRKLADLAAPPPKPQRPTQPTKGRRAR